MAKPSIPAIPSVGPEFERDIHAYLLFRDFREPSAKPQPRAIVQTVLVTVDGTDLELDTLSWDYEQPKAGRGVPADGFTLWVNAGASPISPPQGGMKLSIDARGFVMLWPDGTARSYAIAAYRNTYQGEQATERVSDASWLNVT